MLVFDGDCGFCTRAAQWLVRRTRPRAAVVPWQALALKRWGLDEDECRAAVQFVSASGQVSSGAAAVAGVLSTAHSPWPLAARTINSALIAPLAQRVYVYVAAHRGSLPGATQSCRTDVSQGVEVAG